MKDIRKLNKVIKKSFKNETFEIDSPQFSGTVRISSLSYKRDSFLYGADDEIAFCTVNFEIVEIKKNMFGSDNFSLSPQVLGKLRNKAIRKCFYVDGDRIGFYSLMKMFGLDYCQIGEIKMKK